MNFKDFISSKAITLCFLTISIFVIAMFLDLYDFGLTPIICLTVILLLLVFTWLLISWGMEKKKISQLRNKLDCLDDKYLLGECLTQPTNALELYYYSIMKEISRSAIGVATEAQQEKEDYCNYVESWIHEIKTPLTACNLILSNRGDTSKLKKELKRADNLTEDILYYARLRSINKDTQISQLSIKDTVEAQVKDQMDLLIASNLSLDVQGNFQVYTDGKLLGFIIKQLLINCAKYCPGCQVTITILDGVITVKDNGPGIPSYEIERVIERGFTGTNGRKLGGSTGMGLYIVHELCKQLGISFSIQSSLGEYTSMILAFDSLTKM